MGRRDTEFKARYGPWAIVAGASEGIGAAFAHELARRGLNIVLVARRESPLVAFADQLTCDTGVEVRTLKLDLAEPDSPSILNQETMGLEVGLIVYNAAYSLIAPFLENPLEEHLKEVEVNCRAPLSCAHLFGQRMRDQGRGGIILVSSLAGFQGSALLANYAATKAYNLVLAEGLWDEYRGDGVDVLACCAGATRTPNFERTNPDATGTGRTPVQEPDAVAREALAALGQRPSIITGRMNRLAALLMQRILPRRWAVTIMGKSTRSLYSK